MVHFPRQHGRTNLTAELIGKLVMDDAGCLRVEPAEGGPRSVLVWPSDFTYRIEDNQIQVLNGSSQLVARVGDTVSMGGGMYDLQNLAGTPHNLPPECAGPYWDVGAFPIQSPGEATREDP
jgi:hypothetical protein